MQTVEPLEDFVTGDGLTDAESRGLSIYGLSVRLLAGEVITTLRTHLFNRPSATWLDMWLSSPTCVRLEWNSGPSIAAVVRLLAAKEGDGEISGVPGLRMRSSSDVHALMDWYGGEVPVELSLTRLDN